MAVELEFISVIIPIKKIDEHYPGGFEKYKKDNSSLIGGKIWFDDYIVRDGAMNPMDIELLIEEWESLGLKAFSSNKKSWKDLCVVDFFKGLTLPCDWLKVEGQIAFHINDDKKQIINRNNMAQLNVNS